VESQVDLGGDLERFRVERYPILCGLLTRDIDIFVALNFGCKSCVSVCLTCFTFQLLLWFLLFLVFLL
jgi:hypothetical protein